jgi:CheY-like chemotaxis protein
VKALFITTRPALAALARAAGARAGVAVVSRSPGDPPDGGTYDVVIAPLEDVPRLRAAGTCAPPQVPLVVYARQVHERSRELPEGATALELPFRAAELAAILERLAAPHPGPLPAGEGATPGAGALSPGARPGEGTPAEGPRTRTKILAVDDDLVIRRLYERVLTEAGYTVLVASDGEEAWEKLPGFGPDLVLSDVEMPRLDGYGLCRRVKEHPQWAQTPVIICSSLSQGRDVVRAFESGTDDYLIKPIHEDELLTRVGELLASIEQGGREKILVVDDSKIIRNLIRRGLVKQGLEVDVAGDGQEALELLAGMEVLPSVVISDFEMPRMGGFDLGMALRQDARTRRIPLIMMSARDETRNRKLMKAAGAVAFLGKPFEPDKMVALVERVLAEERLKAEQKRIRELIADDAMAQMVREVRLGKRGVARTETMTLLFSDLKGFSTLCSSLAAPEVVALLNGYFDAMIPAIKAVEGDVDKFIGDAIMARFRDPDDGVARESGPLRAIRAGLGMLEALGRYNAAQPPDRALHMRIGINYGDVVIGAIGSASRRDYTTIGDTVNRAQRLESNAAVDGILIAEPTYQLVKDRVVVRKREDKVKLKGIPEPVDAYDVLGVK